MNAYQPIDCTFSPHERPNISAPYVLCARAISRNIVTTSMVTFLLLKSLKCLTSLIIPHIEQSILMAVAFEDCSNGKEYEMKTTDHVNIKPCDFPVVFKELSLESKKSLGFENTVHLFIGYGVLEFFVLG